MTADVSGPALLVVDDNEDNRYTLVQRLRRLGYTDIATAVDGRRALECLRERAFDLVLLDVMMPELNGTRCWSVSEPTTSCATCPSS